MTKIKEPEDIRDHLWTEHIADNLDTIPEKDRYGIKKKSLLFQLPDFDIIHDVVIDYMYVFYMHIQLICEFYFLFFL